MLPQNLFMELWKNVEASGPAIIKVRQDTAPIRKIPVEKKFDYIY